MVMGKNIFHFPTTPGGRDALRRELTRRRNDCPISAINWDGVAEFHRKAGYAANDQHSHQNQFGAYVPKTGKLSPGIFDGMPTNRRT